MTDTWITTPFGRRPLTLGQIAAGLQVKRAADDAAKPGSNRPAAVNKWGLYRTLTEVRARLGVSDRSLSVLNALLSFHPETALTLPEGSGSRQGSTETGDGAVELSADPSCDLVVFPSNRQLCLRAHGMSEATLRRHVAALVDAGLIARRDSPNGKRYARKAGEKDAGRFSDAFGFDLTPLVARAPELEALAEAERRVRQARQLMKERISLHRRDAAKLIALGLDESLPGDWEGYRQRFLALSGPMRSSGSDAALEALAAELASLRGDIAKTLEVLAESSIKSGNDAHSERHQSNSKTECHPDLEPTSKEVGADDASTSPSPDDGEAAFTLGFVMEACPDVNQWASGGRVKSWADFRETVSLIRPMLGISPDAWREAKETIGGMNAHIVVASILQRSEHSSEARLSPGEAPGPALMTVNGSPAIKSAGGYLRALTDKARAGEFALGPVLMALIGQRLKEKRAAGQSHRSAGSDAMNGADGGGG